MNRIGCKVTNDQNVSVNATINIAENQELDLYMNLVCGD